MACFSRRKCWINRYAATECKVSHSSRGALRYSLLGIECIGDLTKTEPDKRRENLSQILIVTHPVLQTASFESGR
jgi:hypothetical protein